MSSSFGSASRTTLLPLLAAVLLAAVPAATAQVSGVVTDAATGEPLVGAAVRVAGTTVGAATDLDGRYRIGNAPTGEAVLVASYLGYRTDSVAVVVPAGGLVQDFALELAAVQGGEVVVSAQAAGQLAAINEQLASDRIVNVVSAEKIQELPEANAAEAIGRLPGVAITRSGGEANQVVVRGLGPSYTNVTVNGVRLPSTDDSRATDLNSISPELLAGIEVFKALTPDQDADAVGGSVNFRLRTAPARRRVDARLQGGYNALAGALGNYKAVGSVSDRFLGGRAGAIAQLSTERVDRRSEDLAGGFSILADADEPGGFASLRTSSLRLQDRDETRGRLGGSLLLDYRVPGGQVQLSTFASRLDRDLTTRTTSFVDEGVNYNLTLGQVETQFFSSALSGEHALLLGAEFTWSASRAIAVDETPESIRLTAREGSGAYVDRPDDSVDPRDYARAAQFRPDQTRLSFLRREDERRRERDYIGEANLQVPFALGPTVSGSVRLGGKLRDKTRSSVNGGSFLRLDDYFGSDSLRARYAGQLAVINGNTRSISVAPFVDPSYDPTLLGGVSLGFAASPARARELDALLGDVYTRAFTELDDYQADERIGAGYLMVELNVGRLRIIPGVRYERTAFDYLAKQGRITGTETSDDPDLVQDGFARDTTASVSYGDWFPALHLRYRATDWLDLRLARTESISRPSFNQANPRVRRDDTGLRVSRGDVGLLPAYATSYDANVAVRTPRLGLVSVGGYLKELDNVIFQRSNIPIFNDEIAEQLRIDDPSLRGYALSDFANLPNTTHVRGLEFEWQTQLSYLPGRLSGVVLTANYSRIWSETEKFRTFLEVERVRGPNGVQFNATLVDSARTVRMPRQSDHLANVALGYDRGGFSGRVSFLYQGGSLRAPGGRVETDDYVAEYTRFDVSVKQEVGAGLSLYLNLNNLSDARDVEFTGPFRDLLVGEDRYGWTGDVGLRYRL